MSVSGIDIATNSIALNINLGLSKAQNSLQQASSQLATGLRINTPADDPAGFSIAANFQTQISSHDSVSETLQNAQNSVAVASGSVSTITAIVQRIRTLTVAAGDDTIGPAGKAAIQTEINQMTAEINAVSANASFNGQPLFPSGATIKVPAIVQQVTWEETNNGNAPATFTLPQGITAGNLLIAFVTHANAVGNGPAPVVTPPAGWTTLASGDNNLSVGQQIYYRIVQNGDPQTYSFGQSTVGIETGTMFEISNVNPSTPIASYALQQDNGLIKSSPILIASVNNELPIAQFGTNGSGGSAILGADWTQVAQGAGVGTSYHNSNVQVGALTVAGANEQTSYDATFSSDPTGFDSAVLIGPAPIPPTTGTVVPTDVNEGDLLSFSLTPINAEQLGLAALDVSTQATTLTAMTACDAALHTLLSLQTSLGAASIVIDQQNTNNQLDSVNTTEALSTTRDANIAEATIGYTKEKLLSSFGISLLSQSNTNAQAVLALFNPAR